MAADIPSVDCIHVKASPVGRGAVVTIAATLTGEADALRGSITEADTGRVVWEGEVTQDPIHLDEARLWHFDHPNLYALDLTVIAKGETTDHVRTTFGIRTIEELMKALADLKGLNCVLTRFHWQQDEAVLDWCDRNGILVQEEIPLWGYPKEPGEEILALARAQTEEMIRRDFNRPSIIAWGMGNELNGQSPVTVSFMRRLYQYVRSLDDTRLANYVSSTLHECQHGDATYEGDVAMWNDYAGDYRTHLGEEGEGVGRRRVHGVMDLQGGFKPSAWCCGRPVRLWPP